MKTQNDKGVSVIGGGPVGDENAKLEYEELVLLGLFSYPTGMWLNLFKGNSTIKNQGYGPETYKVFVQPCYERRADVLRRALELLAEEDDVRAKFLALDEEERWQLPEKEKLVIYRPSEQAAIDIVNKLCAEFKWDAYVYGSAPDMFHGGYNDKYGARFTQQVNPLVHIRRAGRTIHKALVALSMGKKVPEDISYDFKEIMKIDLGAIAPQTAREMLQELFIPPETMGKLVNHSLAKAGVLELTVERAGSNTESYILDPRMQHVVGRDRRQDILLNSEYSSAKHGTIQFDAGKGIYTYTDNSRNGTFINGCRLKKGKPVILRAGQNLEFGKGERGIVNMAVVAYEEMKK